MLEPYTAPPIKAFEVFSPSRITSPRRGEYTYVFPQNCSALLRFTVEGAAGQTVRFKPCEYMDSTGQVKFTYTWGTGKDIWHDYTLRGAGPESHQILFCYVGCQYVGVTGAVPAGSANPDGLPVIRSLELVHVRAACPEAGSFSCSSAMQNSAHRMIDWAIRSNMSYVATDCPHREKNGWQEENWHMARAISYRFDTHSWLKKITRDLRDTQLPDGHIPTNCPNYLVGIPPHGYWNEAPEWGISGVLLPWHLYEWYGDRTVLQESFESMKKYVDYLSSQAKEGIITSNLGDWYDYGHGKGDGPSQWTPNEVSATAIWALGAKTVAQAAGVLGRTDDAKVYRRLFEQIRKDFQRRFYDRQEKDGPEQRLLPGRAQRCALCRTDSRKGPPGGAAGDRGRPPESGSISRRWVKSCRCSSSVCWPKRTGTTCCTASMRVKDGAATAIWSGRDSRHCRKAGMPVRAHRTA